MVDNGYKFTVNVDKVGLLFTILVAKSKGVRLIMSSSPFMYSFRILRYSVFCLLVIAVFLLCFVQLERTLSKKLKVNAGTLPFILPSTPRTPEVYAIERSCATRRIKFNMFVLRSVFSSNFLVHTPMVCLVSLARHFT